MMHTPPARLAAALLILISTAAQAASVSATMNVSATVIARAVVDIESVPSTIVVAEDDVKRGFVEVVTPVVFRVRTNSRRGYMLQVNNADESFAGAVVRFGESEMAVGNHESWIARPYVVGGDVIQMHVRLKVHAGTAIGTHRFPLDVTVLPL